MEISHSKALQTIKDVGKQKREEARNVYALPMAKGGSKTAEKSRAS
jgi:hypothetical protein